MMGKVNFLPADEPAYRCVAPRSMAGRQEATQRQAGATTNRNEEEK